MPAFKLNGALVYFAAFKNHIGLYQGGKGSVQFAIEKPIPYDLVKKIVIFRMKENQEKKKLKNLLSKKKV